MPQQDTDPKPDITVDPQQDAPGGDPQQDGPGDDPQQDAPSGDPQQD